MEALCGGNAWSMLSADEELGYVYLPMSAPSHDLYGGERPGDNLYSNSIVCLNVCTRKRVWHFQIVPHGLWNYDLPAAPILLDITVDGEPIKAVAQLTKQAFCFVFDRATSEPVWPIHEQPVPESTVPGERPSPTQPIPSKPAPYDRQGFTVDNLIDFTPELRQQAIEIIEQYDHGPLYTPPSERGAAMLPGPVGGSNWVGGALHPNSGWLYIPSFTLPGRSQVGKIDDADAHNAYEAFGQRWMHGPEGLPLTKPRMAASPPLTSTRESTCGRSPWVRARSTTRLEWPRPASTWSRDAAPCRCHSDTPVCDWRACIELARLRSRLLYRPGSSPARLRS